MPADSIPNCKCLSRYGRDEIAGKRATRGISSSSFAKRIAVFHERTSKKDITRSIDITDVFTVFISASFFHQPLVQDAGSISDMMQTFFEAGVFSDTARAMYYRSIIGVINSYSMIELKIENTLF